jgi:hypothetical protein
VLQYEGDLIHVEGTINANDDFHQFSPLPGASVYIISADGSTVEKSLTNADSTGFYSLELDYDRLYNLLFMSDGRYTKILEINTFNVPSEEKEAGGFMMVLDIRMPVAENRRKERLLSRHPIGKCAYSDKTHTFEWDVAYTEKFRKRLERSHWWWPW